MKTNDEVNDHNVLNQYDFTYGHEPVTPPASNASQAGFNNFGQFQGKYSHFSPQFSLKNPVGTHSRSYSIPISSSADTSTLSGTHLSSPHTPLNVNVPLTPSSNSSLVKQSLPSISGGSLTNAYVSTPLLPRSSMQGSSSQGHSRSYSHNVCDPQLGLSRISLNSGNKSRTSSYLSSSSSLSSAFSLNSTSPLSTSLGKTEQRPRAYSSGINSKETMNPFPAPLSSPISPDFLASSAPRMSQRPFSHSYKSSNPLDEQAPGPGPLYRSLSSNSVQPVSYNTTNSTNPNRRPSPPFQPIHVRRSSSSGSSFELPKDFNGSWSGGPDTSAPPSLYDSVQNNIQVDLNNSSNEKIFSLCKDQRGCRFLQRELTECDRNTVHRIFEATREHIVSLMIDPFGNYLCQRLFEQCVPDEITELLSVAGPYLPEIAINQHGTRALQKLVDSITLEHQVNLIVDALTGHVVRLIKDLNGNHVIQKLLLSLDQRGSQFIYDSVCMSILEIGRHRHGCCVLQRCLDYAHDANKQKLVSHIVAQSDVLVSDPFGNYVCQYVIDLGAQQYTDMLAHRLLGRIGQLSVQKFSSNVVEKCLRSSSVSLQRTVIAELMEPKTLCDLLLDNYGNYVVQTALECTASMDSATKQSINDVIYNALAQTRTPYGRRILSKLRN